MFDVDKEKMASGPYIARYEEPTGSGSYDAIAMALNRTLTRFSEDVAVRAASARRLRSLIRAIVNRLRFLIARVIRGDGNYLVSDHIPKNYFRMSDTILRSVR